MRCGCKFSFGLLELKRSRSESEGLGFRGHDCSGVVGGGCGGGVAAASVGVDVFCVAVGRLRMNWQVVLRVWGG